MIDNRKTAVGIVTCARPQTFANLLRAVASNSDVDYIVVVKNKDVDYGELHPDKLISELGISGKAVCASIVGDVGVGCCKNIALMRMIQAGCSHLFLIEDDMEIRSPDVFREYARTATEFGLHHLNFGACWNAADHGNFRPVGHIAKPSGSKLDIYRRLCGAFSYFSSIAIWQAGLIDSKRFVNALDHCEHTYRMSILGMTLPFGAFADVYNSEDLVGYTDAGRQTTLDGPKSETRMAYAIAAAKTFRDRYGIEMRSVPVPDLQKLAGEIGGKFEPASHPVPAAKASEVADDAE